CFVTTYFFSLFFFFSSRRRHTRCLSDWSSDVCSSDLRSLYARYGYTEVITPLIYKTELWKTSGHYDAFHDDMFLMTIEDEEYGVKPMNCPGHCYLFATRKHSYRDLPVRYADFSRLHRF